MKEKKTKEDISKSTSKSDNSNCRAKETSKKDRKELAAFYDQMSTDQFPFGGKFNN